jgi:hypothetical protein
MATGIYSWSQTAASNSSSDSTINWAEGQAPSTVNDSSRAVMAVLAKWRDDISGVAPSNVVLTTGGTANVQTLSTNNSIAALTNGWTITFKAGNSNTSSCTLAVDSLAAKAIQRISGSALTGGEIIAGSVYTVTYHQPADAWVMHSAGVTGAETLLSAGTVSSAATSGHVLSAYTGYRVLRFVLTGITVSTDGVKFQLRTSTDGGSNYDSGASDYSYSAHLISDTDVTQTLNDYRLFTDSADDAIEICQAIGSTAGEVAHLEVWLYGAASTTLYKSIKFHCFYVGSGVTVSGQGHGTRHATSDIDAVQFLVSAGTFSGSYAIYGLL